MTTGTRRLSLLASAVAGRLLDVAPADAGTATWTDGATVFVDETASSSDQLVGVVAQACMLDAGSFTRDIVSALRRRPAQIPRYLAIEVHRALAVHEPLLPGPVRRLFDGAAAARSGSAAESLMIAAGRDLLDTPPRAFGTIQPRRVRLDAVGATGSDAADREPQPVMPPSLREMDSDDGGTESEVAAAELFSPISGGGVIGRLLKRMLSDARGRDTGPPGSEATHFSWRGGRISRAGRLVATTAVANDDAALVRTIGWRYPEWDVSRRSYRDDWCVVTEQTPLANDTSALALPDTHALRRVLARVGLDVERRHRQPQGDDIDIDAVVDGRVQLSAGIAPDETFYIDNIRRRRDLAVLVLLDVSGSAGQPGANGTAVHEAQRSAAAALTTALHGLGDRVALFAFRSMGRRSVQLTPVKNFDDVVGSTLLRRLEALVPGAYTRLGAAIRHGAAVLEARGGTGRRLLLVLSDGFAYDHGYEGAYGEADARRALAEARRRGTACVCLSIGGVTDAEALRRVFGTAAHASVPRVEQLPGVVGTLFRSALRAADSQRRSWQRSERARERLAMERRTA